MEVGGEDVLYRGRCLGVRLNFGLAVAYMGTMALGTGEWREGAKGKLDYFGMYRGLFLPHGAVAEGKGRRWGKGM